MKISYGITVYNEHRELDNLLYHLSKHIRKEDEVVVTRDISKVGDKSIMQDEFYALEKVLEKYEYGTYFQPRQLKVTTFEFNKDFSKLKNYTKEQCSGDYIFHIDADEIPNEILLKQLPTQRLTLLSFFLQSQSYFRQQLKVLREGSYFLQRCASES